MKLFICNSDRHLQYLSTVLGTLTMACVGMHLTWVSPVLPRLMADDSPFGTPITEQESSWIASIYLLGAGIGCFPACLIVEKYGRKPTLLLSAIPIGLPWFIMPFTTSTIVLLICRFLAGFGISFPLVGLPIYVSEIADKDIRGSLATILGILKFTGVLYVLGVGPFLSYKTLTLSCGVMPIIFLISFYFMPESPYYLVKKNKQGEAYCNLIRLLGSSNDEILKSRLDEIESTVKYDMKTRTHVWEFFTKKQYRKSLIIIAGVKTLQALSGTYTITSYVEIIIKESNSNISPEISSVVSGVVQICSAIIASTLCDRVGRRKVFLTSTIGCAISSFGEGLYFYLQNKVQADLSNFNWIPTTFLLLYFLTNTMGLYSLPFVLLGELFATNVKGFAVAVSSSYAIGLAFVVTKMFQPMASTLGLHVVFWTLTSTCVVGTVFIFFILPETKGKTLEEIQGILNPKRREDTASTNDKV